MNTKKTQRAYFALFAKFHLCENYDPKNMMRYRNNVVYDFSANKMYIFDFNKNYRSVDLVDPNAEQKLEA